MAHATASSLRLRMPARYSAPAIRYGAGPAWGRFSAVGRCPEITASTAAFNARYLMDRHPPSLGQTVAAEFMRQGHFAGHIRRVRLAYRDQRDALVSELRRVGADGVIVDAPDQGKHLIAYLGRGLSDVAVDEAAHRRGVVARAISRMYRKAPPRSGLLLGFTGHTIEAIVSAAAALAGVIGERAARYRSRHTSCSRPQP